jgi:CBS domain-containing protein
MKYTVKYWMLDVVVYIDPDQTVLEALGMMRRRYIHSLIVRKTAQTPEGILTATDINDKIIAMERNPAKMKVKEIMTAPLVTVTEDTSLKDCALTMKERHFHHLPVVDEGGKVIGMISSTDFLVAAEAMAQAPGEKLT